MYTEEEAKTKWCPYNKGEMDSKLRTFQSCIALECMMWKWVTSFPDGSGYEDHNTKQQGLMHIAEPDRENMELIGYCGLTKGRIK